MYRLRWISQREETEDKERKKKWNKPVEKVDRVRETGMQVKRLS